MPGVYFDANVSDYQSRPGLNTGPGAAHKDSAFAGLMVGSLVVAGVPLAALMLGPLSGGLGAAIRLRYMLYAAGGAAIADDLKDAPTAPQSDIPVYTPGQLGALTGVTPNRTEFSRIVRRVGGTALALWLYVKTMQMEAEDKRKEAALERRRSLRRRRSGFDSLGGHHFRSH